MFWVLLSVVSTFIHVYLIGKKKDLPCGSVGKESTCNIADLGSNSGLGISPGEGKGYPLQHSGLENPVDGTDHGGCKESDTE